MFKTYLAVILFFFSLPSVASLQEDLSEREVLIVANAPGIDGELVKQYSDNRYVIALDGSADKLKSIGLVPNAILGDFDSVESLQYWGIRERFDEITNESASYQGHHGVLIVPSKDQNLTDLSKGVNFCDSRNAKEIYIANALGGRVDHTLGNIRFLRNYYRPDRKVWIVDSSQRIEFVRDRTTIIEGNPGDQCAIMAAPEGVVTSTGLEYEMTDYKLVFGYSESSCNLLKNASAEVIISGEALVIHPN